MARSTPRRRDELRLSSDILAGTAPGQAPCREGPVAAILSLDGHPSAMPCRHVPALDGPDRSEAAPLMPPVARIARAPRDATGWAGVSLVLSDGAAAGQDVDHLHLQREALPAQRRGGAARGHRDTARGGAGPDGRRPAGPAAGPQPPQAPRIRRAQHQITARRGRRLRSGFVMDDVQQELAGFEEPEGIERYPAARAIYDDTMDADEVAARVRGQIQSVFGTVNGEPTVLTDEDPYQLPGKV